MYWMWWWIIIGGILLAVLRNWNVFRWRRHRLSFEGKVVWITGASSGIGEALAYEFAGKGARLVLSARNEKKLNLVASAIGEERGVSNVLVLPLDLGKDEMFQACYSKVLDVFGKVDVLVNNGGVSFFGKVVNTEVSTFKDVMDINFHGAVGLVHLVLPEMLKRRSGMIVFVNSVKGHFTNPFSSAYTASKHALKAFAGCLRSELHGSGILVSSCYPGYVETELPLGRIGESGKPLNIKDPRFSGSYRPGFVARKMIRELSLEHEDFWIAQFKIRLTWFLLRLFPRLMNGIVRAHEEDGYRALYGGLE